MHDKFSSYEVVAIIAPGSVLASGLYVIFLLPLKHLPTELVGLGELGLIIFLSFALGHLVQALGNLLEKVFWRIFGGWPTNKILKPNQTLLSSDQRKRLVEAVKRDFSLDFDLVSENDWKKTVREIDIRLQGNAAFDKVKQHNQTYGFTRGLASSFLVLAGITFTVQPLQWFPTLLCFLASILAFIRMYRFGMHYGQGLLQAYLNRASSS
ncbi:MAG: hypothetical protein NTW61_03110 [Candidatus Melainabacteria bacterium]|nr:hypothetical protein [Candidatus Melainabacteria bacterium]